MFPSCVMNVESEEPAKRRRIDDELSFSGQWKRVCGNISAIFATATGDRHLTCPAGRWELINTSDMYVRDCYTQTAGQFQRLRQAE